MGKPFLSEFVKANSHYKSNCKGVIHMADKATVQRIAKNALDIKLDLLDLCHQTLIHIGGDMSVSDMMAAIWTYAMGYDYNFFAQD